MCYRLDLGLMLVGLAVWFGVEGKVGEDTGEPAPSPGELESLPFSPCTC